MNEENDLAREPEEIHLPAMADPYTHGVLRVSEFIKFEYRFAALVWLHRKTSSAIDVESGELRSFRESVQQHSEHWWNEWNGPAELGDVLGDSISVLEHDAASISCGAIVAACASALESLFKDLLPPPASDRKAPRGLVASARVLASLWPDTEQSKVILASVRWLAGRRNSFAHCLIDEGGPWDHNPTATRYTFDDDAVEETFERVGEIVVILDGGYDRYVCLRDR